MKPTIPFQSVPKLLLTINLMVGLFYLWWWFMPGNMGNPWLYGFLLFGEIYHLVMAATFWHTLWPNKHKTEAKPVSLNFAPTVDVFIPVAGEPVEVIRETALAAMRMRYQNHRVYILNDGYVAGKENWKDVEMLAADLGITCITRKKPGGAKAGNINHALTRTKGEVVVIFDADMVPHLDFLAKTMPHLADPKTGFVQTPQFYANAADNYVTAGAWDQQKLFFGPILQGKDKSNAVFICGTNVAIKREVLNDVGGMVEDNIAEDFLTSLSIHKQGWKSVYLTEVLAEGLAPLDLGAYYKQQFRWARGSMEVLFGHNPIFAKGLSWRQKIEYLASALYYLNGLIILIDIVMPLIYLFTGIQPVAASTTSFALFFLPFMFLNLYTLNIASGSDVSFKTFSFTYSLWYLHVSALVSILLQKKVGFVVTSKEVKNSRQLRLAWPHMVYMLMAIAGIFTAVNREGLTPAVATNAAWVFFSIMLFLPYIFVAANIRPHQPVPISLARQRA